MMTTRKHALIAMISAFALSNGALAAVSAQEAGRLKGELTPFGAERAGNADGSIPEWTGGYTKDIPGDEPGGRRGDPFADEQPLFSVSVDNMEEHADMLTEGTKLLMERYPDTFRIDVYPTHRTAAAPQWVYDNTYANATRGTMVNNVPENVYGGVPFPLAKTGAEVMWNHMLRWRGGEDFSHGGNWYQLLPDGRRVLISDGVTDEQVPYYFEDSNLEEFQEEDGLFWKLIYRNYGPPIRAGQAVLAHEYLDQSKLQTWVYLTGQRRVRRLPNACCDTPTPAAAGELFFDELYTWVGTLDRFDWELVGKKEMYIPYNANNFLQPTSDAEVLNDHHWDPDHMRWEKHRVWVVDATRRDGERHQVARSRYYCDEDTWLCVLGDRWGDDGQLWKTVWSQTFVAPDRPATLIGAYGAFDHLDGSAFIANLYNEEEEQFEFLERRSPVEFSPSSMAGNSFR
ncbi:DUF1329 domain-containing protein [Marinobacter pelagius]|uniref:DUF1329 domain-containing protein n=1 Tax=Marinobacter sp. C7 TaxID=2951363 RepID=UPI001EF05826|nr:DUF1329 domain-containing protein [Marinobacter sp. C7]MCG7201484.1 DUF1329 domain-containing protein [Marinobacter sp. C7]